MLGHQGMALFERIRRCGLVRIGLVGGSMSLEVLFEVSRAQVRSSSSFLLSSDLM